MRFLKMLIFLLIVVSSVSNAQKMTLEEIIDRSLKIHPLLKAKQTELAVAKTKPAQFSNLPDPSLKFGLANMPLNSFSFNQEPMTGKILALSQSFPFPGKLNAIESMYRFDEEISFQDYRKSENEIIADIEKSYFALHYKQSAISITSEIHKLLQSVLKVVEGNYVVSKSRQQNLFLINVQIKDVENNLNRLIAEAGELSARLNIYMDRDFDEELQLNILDGISEKQVSLSQLLTDSKLHSPDLKKTKLMVYKSQESEKVFEYDFYPNFNFSAQYTQRDHINPGNRNLNDLISLIVGINIPLNYGSNKSAKIEEAKLRQKYFSEQYDYLLQQLKMKFGAAIAKINGIILQNQHLSDEIIPHAEQSFNTALSDYQFGKLDFIHVINAQKDILKFRLEQAKLKTDYNIELSGLKKLTGKSEIDLTHLKMEDDNEK